MIISGTINETELALIRQLVVPLRVEPRVEGQKIEDGEIIIGGVAGPLIHVTHVLHEAAHYIEIDDARMNKPGWGFKYGKWVDSPFPNKYCHGRNKYSTDQHIQREIRTWAYQANLQQHLKLPVDFEDMAESSQYLPDFYNYRKGKTTAERMKHVAADIETLARTVEYSFPKILAELERKRVVLRSLRIEAPVTPVGLTE